MRDRWEYINGGGLWVDAEWLRRMKGHLPPERHRTLQKVIEDIQLVARSIGESLDLPDIEIEDVFRGHSILEYLPKEKDMSNWTPSRVPDTLAEWFGE